MIWKRLSCFIKTNIFGTPCSPDILGNFGPILLSHQVCTSMFVVECYHIGHYSPSGKYIIMHSKMYVLLLFVCCNQRINIAILWPMFCTNNLAQKPSLQKNFFTYMLTLLTLQITLKLLVVC